MKERIQELFQEYGTLKLIRKIKQPKQKRIAIYGYSFAVSNIFDEEDDKVANFLIVDQEELVSIAFFGVRGEILDKQHVLEQLNDVNKKILYGKFLVDDDNDVHWEYSFDPIKSNKEEILSIIKGFMFGLKVLLDWKQDEIHGKE